MPQASHAHQGLAVPGLAVLVDAGAGDLLVKADGTGKGRSSRRGQRSVNDHRWLSGDWDPPLINYHSLLHRMLTKCKSANVVTESNYFAYVTTV